LLAIFNFRDGLIARVVPDRPTAPAGPAAPWSPTLRDQDLSLPVQYNDTHVHPIEYLAKNAENDFSALLQRQSRTLEEAVAEYKRRYNIPPPPHFDKWFQFAKDRNVQLIDEFDTIYHSLLPFWGLKPVTIRRRVQEAIGFDGNNLIALMVRGGKVTHVRSGQEWQQKATIGMMDKFIQYLPDMDLAFNIHDEPRVVVPHDELSRLVQVAKDRNMPAAFANPSPKDAFSPRPKDLNAGERVDEVKVTRFNVFAHQPTWIPSRLSCSPDSPARALEEEITPDNIAAYAISELGFVYNDTAFSDVCNSPSFGTSHGFFDRPNAFNVVHDLVPVFSQSKMSSFQDILYPSPWYWYGKVTYDSHKDVAWEKKEGKLWWVGSTTGGFSRDGGWRRQHRQKFVHKLNAPDQAKIMYDAHLTSAASREDKTPDWQIRSVPRSDYAELMDVHFSHVGQCDPGDCDAQKEFFKIVPPADQQDAWKYKYLLDMDGNAFSGRFYAFLKSHSLVFKMAVFREWHAEWLKPWIHYVPL
ncbi:glycosyltransferase family 90 protein, partial [Aureobasidium melanogenum]